MEYHKIDTLFDRDPKSFVVDPARLRHPVFATIREWDVTEKIDGTNVRILLHEDGSVKFGGRTDNAQMPADFIQQLIDTFTPAKLQQAMWLDGPVAAVLYGEGYGAGIQKGGCYRPTKAFRLFDVLVAAKWWLDWTAVVDVAEKLNIQTVPYLGRWTLEEIIERVRTGIPSECARSENPLVNAPVIAEGIVARPIETLFDKRGERVILKLKTRDFVSGKR